MSRQLLYLRQHTNPDGVFLAKGHRTRLKERKKRCCQPLPDQHETAKCILRGWLRIFTARVFGIRLRMVYQRSLYAYTLNIWLAVYNTAKAKTTTIFYFRKWLRHRCLCKTFFEFHYYFCAQTDKKLCVQNFRVRRFHDLQQGASGYY